MTNRRTFTKSVGVAACLAATATARSTLAGATIGVITETDGPHLQAYLQALRDTAEVASVVLADSENTEGQSHQLAKRILGDKLSATFSDYAEMLERKRPAMALIALEASKAPPAVRAALQAGCHVMAEKPACVRVEDFRPLARLAEERDRHLMLALANRLNAEVETAQKLISDGNLGQIFGVEMHLVADQTRLTRPAYQQSWYASKERAGGGHLIWLGIHWLDLAMYLTGSSIREVNAMIANVGGQPIDVEDSAALTCRFDNGALGTFTSGYYLDSGYHSHIKIWGSQGWLEIQSHGDTPLKWYSQLDKQAGVQSLAATDQPRGYTPLVRACVHAAIGIGPAPLTTSDSLRVIETVFAAYRASESGCREVIDGREE